MTKCTLSNLSALDAIWRILSPGRGCALQPIREQRVRAAHRSERRQDGRTAAGAVRVRHGGALILRAPEPLIRIISALSRPPTAAAAPLQILQIALAMLHIASALTSGLFARGRQWRSTLAGRCATWRRRYRAGVRRIIARTADHRLVVCITAGLYLRAIAPACCM
jgi:hypothetical protein